MRRSSPGGLATRLRPLTAKVPKSLLEVGGEPAAPHARYVQGTDGSRRYLGHRDTQRNEDCAFVNTTQGWRCLPTVYPSPGGTLGQTELRLGESAVAMPVSVIDATFTDPSCSQPAMDDFTPYTLYDYLGSQRIHAAYIFLTRPDALGHPRVEHVFNAAWQSVDQPAYSLQGPTDSSCAQESTNMTYTWAGLVVRGAAGGLCWRNGDHRSLNGPGWCCHPTRGKKRVGSPSG
ncbi:MAG: hypothetical protein HY904_09085 [Deltaproteobacteria bacterium]|nr:hypothetical protein [Deltaproteobacteria bacterium]